MPFADHRYVIAHLENMKRRVLTYNVCWGCMTNEERRFQETASHSPPSPLPRSLAVLMYVFLVMKV